MSQDTTVPTRTDEDIKHEVTESLYWDTRVDASDVGVLVDGGRVTLVGSVPTFRARAAAREDAQIIAGVRTVDNHVDVVVSPELDTPTDDELHASVLDVLGADPDLGAEAIDVKVEQGRVHLSGTVTTFWEKELARSVVSVLPGVRGMANELAVVPARARGDADIAESIIAALRRDRHVDLTYLDVEVEDGRVTLAGQVPNERIREQVLRAARYTQGVQEIHDQLHRASDATATPDGSAADEPDT